MSISGAASGSCKPIQYRLLSPQGSLTTASLPWNLKVMWSSLNQFRRTSLTPSTERKSLNSGPNVSQALVTSKPRKEPSDRSIGYVFMKRLKPCRSAASGE
jgi:hypothetical protein